MKTVSAVSIAVLVAGCSSSGGGPESASQPPTPIAQVAEGSVLQPGRYSVPFVGLTQDTVQAEVEVPEGFEPYNGSFLWNGSGEASYALSFWRITGVNPDPCRRDPPQYVPPGSDLGDLATALRRQPHREGPKATSVELDGYSGLYLELSLPRRFDPERCATGSYEAWQAKDPETYGTYPRYQYGPGWVDRIWILDVEGERLVVNAAFDPRISEADLSALETMVESVDISTQ